ncbi:MAG TPA: glycosyltransferase [Qipengyuania sp.]|nr:glycosyltransferase [Qipengyuania sp.]
MRICIPIHSFEPGGVERVGLRLAERWQAAGHDVIVVLGRARGATRAQAPMLDYRTRPEPISTAAWETPWLIWCLWRYLRRHPADVIFCAGNTYTVVCVAMKLLLGRRCPPMLVKISNDLVRADYPAPVQALYRLWLRVQGRLLDRFVALAEPMAPQLVEELRVDPARVCAIADPALREDEIAALPAPLPDPAAGRRFLAVARLNRQKNLPLLLDAFARIAQDGDRLTIAGEGPERARIERRIAELGLADKVVMLGHVADIRPLLDAAHALVLSSDYEGVPAVVPEALAAGRPVAATDCCVSMRWLLQDGSFGSLTPVGDTAALADAMVHVADMPASPAEMHRFSALFTLGKAAPAYLAAMQALVGDRVARRTNDRGDDGGNRTDRAAPC